MNEANMSVSPNTSDGSYEGVEEAIVHGIVAARQTLDRLGRSDVALGFSFAGGGPGRGRRLLGPDRRARHPRLPRRARLRRSADLPGPRLARWRRCRPARPAREVVEALTLLRQCYLPKADLGPDVDLWVTENGYATNLGRDEARQDADLRSTLRAVHRWSGTLGVTDYRWFNLRDNRSTGTDLFDAVGLQRDDGTPKPAFSTFGRAIAGIGTLRDHRTG